MSQEHGGFSTERPILLGQTGPTRYIRPPRGGGYRVAIKHSPQYLARIDAGFAAALAAFDTQVLLSASLHAADPQLVLVFEGLDERVDLSKVARKLGFEILTEAEDATEPTEEFALISQNPRDPKIGTCLHAVCMSQQIFNELMKLWRSWKRSSHLPFGYSELRELFGHLKDVRPWGPQDRLKMIDWSEHFAGQIVDGPHSIEIELWYRAADRARTKAQSEVTSLVEYAGGRVLASAVITEIGYHGLKCEVPTSILLDLAQGRVEDVQLVKSANVMFLRVTGQSHMPELQALESPTLVEEPLPGRPPVVCILDGVPTTNHPLLAGRVVVYDPDDLSSESPVGDRRHGTGMSSVVIWGDLSAGESPSDRKVLVRPILVPSRETSERQEELPATELPPDLMWRIFRELFEHKGEQTPVAPDVTIINLSVADPSTPFDSILSSWARMIDWLSYKYGVLVVVSAGNYPRLPLSSLSSIDLASLSGDDRRQAVLAAQNDDQMNRRLLSPAESINALTVGAVHSDSAGSLPPGGIVDPADGLTSISPVTALGGGYRRSIKPELAAPGGRVVFSQPYSAEPAIAFRNPGVGPGICVAAQSPNGTAFISGTSPSAAMVTRRAARLCDTVDSITAGLPLTRRQRASALKALLVHSTDQLDNFPSDYLQVEKAIGHGQLTRDFSQGCAANEAVVLYVGSLGAAEENELLFPLPNGLSVREVKRITATLAWLSPVNWRHRSYRCAALSILKPGGDIPDLGAPRIISSEASKRGATTVQHLTWETQGAFASGKGSNLNLRVKCFEQAGGLKGERIDYAVALSLWVAPTLNINVYQQIREQIQGRISIRL